MAAGVAAGRHAGASALLLISCSAAALLLALAALRPRFLAVVILPVTLFAAGAALMFSAEYHVVRGVLPELARRNTLVTATMHVSSLVSEGRGRCTFFAEVSEVRCEAGAFRCGERTLVVASGRVSGTTLASGARAVAKGKLNAPGKNAGWLLSKGAASLLHVAEEDLSFAGGSAGTITSLVQSSRQWISRRYRKVFTKETSGLMEGITLSKLDGMDERLQDDLRRSGLSHIVAVSGLHVGSVALITVAIMGALGAGRRSKYLTAAAGALMVLAISNFKVSALRACLMALMSFAGLILGRDYDPLAGLSIAGVLILAFNPGSLFDQGFQLSFAAATGILLSAPAAAGARGVRLMVSVCAGAQLGILPVMIARSEGFAVTAVAANILVVPVVGVLLIAGWGTAAITVFSTRAAACVAFLPETLARYAMTVASVCARVPLSTPLGPAGSALSFALYVGALIWFVRSARLGRAMYRPAVACILAVLLAMTPCLLPAGPRGGNRAIFLDVGEGEATLLRDETGATVLVDGGPDSKVLKRKLARHGVRKLDLVVLTHPHSDHMDGLLLLHRTLGVGTMLEPGLPGATSDYSRFLKDAQDGGVALRVAREGQVIRVSDRIELEVLYAPVDMPETPNDLNDCSIVIMARVGGMRVLLTGDVGPEAIETVLGRHPDLACEVLKVAHHGAAGSTSRELLSSCRPLVATISTSRDNGYGHPSAECIRLLEGRGVEIVRTYAHGDIEVHSRSGRIAVFTERR